MADIIDGILGAGATLMKWQDFRRHSGHWPVFSIATAVVSNSLLIVVMVVCIWYGGRHDWSDWRLGGGFLAVGLPVLFAGSWARNKVWLSDVRSARAGGKDNPDVWHVHVSHKRRQKTTQRISDFQRIRFGYNSFKVVLSLVMLGCILLAQVIFWIFGW